MKKSLKILGLCTLIASSSSAFGDPEDYCALCKSKSHYPSCPFPTYKCPKCLSQGKQRCNPLDANCLLYHVNILLLGIKNEITDLEKLSKSIDALSKVYNEKKAELTKTCNEVLKSKLFCLLEIALKSDTVISDETIESLTNAVKNTLIKAQKLQKEKGESTIENLESLENRNYHILVDNASILLRGFSEGATREEVVTANNRLNTIKNFFMYQAAVEISSTTK